MLDTKKRNRNFLIISASVLLALGLGTYNYQKNDINSIEPSKSKSSQNNLYDVYASNKKLDKDFQSDIQNYIKDTKNIEQKDKEFLEKISLTSNDLISATNNYYTLVKDYGYTPTDTMINFTKHLFEKDKLDFKDFNITNSKDLVFIPPFTIDYDGNKKGWAYGYFHSKDKKGSIFIYEPNKKDNTSSLVKTLDFNQENKLSLNVKKDDKYIDTPIISIFEDKANYMSNQSLHPTYLNPQFLTLAYHFALQDENSNYFGVNSKGLSRISEVKDLELDKQIVSKFLNDIGKNKEEVISTSSSNTFFFNLTPELPPAFGRLIEFKLKSQPDIELFVVEKNGYILSFATK